MSPAGRLVLIGTPIGNREDLSPRARRAILEADVLLCEDTRSPTRLLGEGVALPRRISCFVANEHERLPLLLEHLEQGRTVGFVSEAGLPIWSDPGLALVRAAVEAGHEVDVVPGPTAGTVALCLSGFEPIGATFLGFLPRSGAEREARLQQIVDARGATILYEAGNRTPALLTDLKAVLPDYAERRAVVARELTKKHQEVQRGTVFALQDRILEPLRGEVTVVVEGTTAEVQDRALLAAREVLETVLDPGLKPRERARRLAKLTDQDARELYDRLRAISVRRDD